MSLRSTLPLACLTPEELASITGGTRGAGSKELNLELEGGGGRPVTGTVGLTHLGASSSLQGTLSVSEQGWAVGVATRFSPSRNVDLEAHYSTDGRNHGWGIRGTIRFMRA